MSVKIEPREGFKNMGRLVITSKYDVYSNEDVYHRIEAIISMLSLLTNDALDANNLYYMLSILEDYLPTEEEWKKLLS